MPDKYLELLDGRAKQVEALDVSTGAPDAGSIVALNSDGEIDESMLPTSEVTAIQASEGLAAGDFVNIWDDAGTLKVRKADGSGGHGKKADGYVEAAYTTGQMANVVKGGKNSSLSALTKGLVAYLSTTTPGAATTTVPPEVDGHIIQVIGKTLSDTEIWVDIQENPYEY